MIKNLKELKLLQKCVKSSLELRTTYVKTMRQVNLTNEVRARRMLMKFGKEIPELQAMLQSLKEERSRFS